MKPAFSNILYLIHNHNHNHNYPKFTKYVHLKTSPKGTCGTEDKDVVDVFQFKRISALEVSVGVPDRMQEYSDTLWNVVMMEVITGLKERATSLKLDETIDLLQYQINVKAISTPTKEHLLSIDKNVRSSFNITDNQDDFQFIKVELEEFKQKVAKSGGGLGEGFAVDGKYFQSL